MVTTSPTAMWAGRYFKQDATETKGHHFITTPHSLWAFGGFLQPERCPGICFSSPSILCTGRRDDGWKDGSPRRPELSRDPQDGAARGLFGIWDSTILLSILSLEANYGRAPWLWNKLHVNGHSVRRLCSLRLRDLSPCECKSPYVADARRRVAEFASAKLSHLLGVSAREHLEPHHHDYKNISEMPSPSSFANHIPPIERDDDWSCSTHSQAPVDRETLNPRHGPHAQSARWEDFLFA
ncbi:hypothetical protein BKA70DRAFT_501724 [Coprinopsis sp. MPI-PUGE-AT-0042]|nr:hypothetical protein BKA70DRAFT_501724 [Coprinopsis sp. MPI-PUGE-AT-0042]